jgi:hypothetical protein
VNFSEYYHGFYTFFGLPLLCFVYHLEAAETRKR